jgi:hypothetical protein
MPPEFDLSPQAPGTADLPDNVDQLLGSVDSEPREIPMGDESDTLQEESAAPAQASPQEFEFTWNGKQIKAPKDKFTQWAQQGYDYAQKMAEFNSRTSEFDQRYKIYSEIDEYAKTNPEWWNRLQQAYQTRDQQQQQQQTSGEADSNDPVLTKVQQLVAEQVGPVKQFIESWQQKEAAQKKQAEDAQLSEQIQSIRKNYANLDWEGRDESGHNLEMRVLKFAHENGLRNFDHAFRLFNHENLLKLAEERGKEAVAKDIQKKSKLGLLGQTPTPKKGLQSAQDIKSKNYDQLIAEGLAELGIS